MSNKTTTSGPDSMWKFSFPCPLTTKKVYPLFFLVATEEIVMQLCSIKKCKKKVSDNTRGYCTMKVNHIINIMEMIVSYIMRRAQKLYPIAYLAIWFHQINNILKIFFC